MSILDKLFGHPEDPQRKPAPPQEQAEPTMTADEQALERYRYMLQTAPPETIEQAHQEAFAKLTPEQRRMVLQQLSTAVPGHERANATDDPQSLARMATRAEIRQPGTMERLFGNIAAPGMGGGMGFGGMMGGSFLSSLAGSFAGSMIAQHFFNNTGMGQQFFGGGMSPDMFGSGEGHHYTATPDAANDDTDNSQDDYATTDIDVDDIDAGDSGGDDQFV